MMLTRFFLTISMAVSFGVVSGDGRVPRVSCGGGAGLGAAATAPEVVLAAAVPPALAATKAAAGRGDCAAAAIPRVADGLLGLFLRNSFRVVGLLEVGLAEFVVLDQVGLDDHRAGDVIGLFV